MVLKQLEARIGMNGIQSGMFRFESDILKNVKVMNFKLMFPNPMSKPVAAPHGPILVK